MKGETEFKKGGGLKEYRHDFGGNMQKLLQNLSSGHYQKIISTWQITQHKKEN